MIQDVKFSNYYDIVTKSKIPVLVEFYATWCDHCAEVNPIVEKLSEEYQDTPKFCRVDIDEEELLTTKNKIKGLPTLLFIKKEREVERLVGDKNYDEIKEAIDNLLK